MESQLLRTGSESRSEGMLRAAACLLLLFVVVLHCLVVYSPDLYFSIDSKLSSVPQEGVGPFGSLVLDGLVLLAFLLSLIAELRAGRPLNRIAIVLAWLPLPWLIWQGFHGHGNLGDVAVGSQWFAVIIGGAAACHIARDPRWRLVILCSLMAMVVPLAIKGAVQVFIDHHYTVQDYLANKESILASLGIQPGSSAADNFERRLLQAEATGWFALSNVYGTILAAFTAFWITLALASIRRRLNDGTTGFIIIITLAALLGLVLSFSKGAYGAGLIGIAMAVCVLAPRKWRALVMKWSFPATCALIVLACIAVAVRGGILGEKLEGIDGYSLLFRWFYWEGSSKIIAHNILTGVGPDGFQNAYLHFRPPTGTEVVASPHNIFITWLSCLGVFAGLSWTGLVFYFLWKASKPLRTASRRLLAAHAGEGEGEVEKSTGTTQRASHSSSQPVALNNWQRNRVILTLIAAFVPGIIAAWWLNADAFTIDYNVIFMPMSIIVGCIAAYAVWTAAWETPWAQLRWAVWAALTVILVHSQIEMTMNTPGSALFVFTLLGLAASSLEGITQASRDQTSSSTPEAGSNGKIWRIVDVALVCGAAVVLIGHMTMATIPVARSQALQAHAADEMQHVGDVREAIRNMRQARNAQDWLQALDDSRTVLTQEPTINLNVDGIERDMSAAMSAGDSQRERKVVTDTTNLLDKQVVEAEAARIQSALPLIEQAIPIGPYDFSVSKEASRLWAVMARHDLDKGDTKQADDALAHALTVAQQAMDFGRGEVEIKAFLASRLADNADRPTTEDQLRKAIAVQELVVAEDPHGLERWSDLAGWYDDLLKLLTADPSTSSASERSDLLDKTLHTYQQVLAVNQDMHLDPYGAQLSEDKLKAVQSRIAELTQMQAGNKPKQ